MEAAEIREKIRNFSSVLSSSLRGRIVAFNALNEVHHEGHEGHGEGHKIKFFSSVSLPPALRKGR
jgi:hypothetical protein